MTDAPDEIITENWNYRVARIKNNYTKQFQMVYFGKYTHRDTEKMSISQFNLMYNLLYEQKKSEKEAHDKAIKEAKAKQAATRKPPPRRHR